MSCKNCQTKLNGEKKFCSNCGAKVITNRLNFKTVTEEFFATFISWDNKFFKTLMHMFIKPQVVVNDYLSGVRKRYMQPFSFMFIALTLYGVFMYFAKDQMLEYMEFVGSLNPKNEDVKVNELLQGYQEKVGVYSMNYFNIITFIMIPFFSLVNLLVFYKKQNFIEHNISVLYSYASYQYAFVIIASVALLFSVSFIYIIPFTFLYLLIYHMYFFKKLFDLSFWKIIYKTFFFLSLIFILYVVISIISISIFFINNKDILIN